MVSASAHVCQLKRRTPPPVPSPSMAPDPLSELTTMISAAAPESLGRSAMSGEVSTRLWGGSGSAAPGPFHSDCRLREKTPIGTSPLHVSSTGFLLPNGTHTPPAAPSVRHGALRE